MYFPVCPGSTATQITFFACCRCRAGGRNIGERCAGESYNCRRCCNPEAPCECGEGDCDGPADGGLHDGHAGCRGELVCASNDCKKFGLFYHVKDNCCNLAVNPPAVRSRGGGAWVVMVLESAGWWGTLQPPATRCTPSVHLM